MKTHSALRQYLIGFSLTYYKTDFFFRYRLKVIMEMSQEGLSVLPEESSGRNRMLQTLNTARGVSWLVVLNQAAIHIIYLVIPIVFTIFGTERYLPTTPGESFGK